MRLRLKRNETVNTIVISSGMYMALTHWHLLLKHSDDKVHMKRVYIIDSEHWALSQIETQDIIIVNVLVF